MKTPSVVVTGASRGIGRALTETFLEAGYRVWALARSFERSDAQPPSSDRLQRVRVDVGSPEAISAFCGKLLADEGPPQVLINNAGVMLTGPLSGIRLEDYEATLAVNTRAPLLFCQMLIPKMAGAGGGRVINIASTAGLKGFPYTAVYCTSKHALVGLTRALAREFAHKKVTVNAVCPGYTETDMLSQAAEAVATATARKPEEIKKTLVESSPMKRAILPKEVAALCLYLASPAAAAITGAAYAVDGGETS